MTMMTLRAPAPTGVHGLDFVLGGGLDSGALVFIVGPTGAGKTVLASQMVFSAARRGMRALVLTSYSEGHVKLLDHLRSFAFYDDALVSQEITLLALPGILPSDPEAAATTIVQTIRQTGAQIVLIDGFQGITPLLHPGSDRMMLAALANQLVYLKTTALLTVADTPRTPALNPELTTTDLTIGLHYTLVERRHQRALEVIKQRGRAPVAGLHTYTISAAGLTVQPRTEALPLPEQRPQRSGRAAFGLPELDALIAGGPNRWCSNTARSRAGCGGC